MFTSVSFACYSIYVTVAVIYLFLFLFLVLRQRRYVVVLFIAFNSKPGKFACLYYLFLHLVLFYKRLYAPLSALRRCTNRNHNIVYFMHSTLWSHVVALFRDYNNGLTYFRIYTFIIIFVTSTDEQIASSLCRYYYKRKWRYTVLYTRQIYQL